jgi:hypothetical protein
LHVKQDRSDLASGGAICESVKRAKLKGQPCSLAQRELKAAQRWPGAATSQASMEALDAVKPRSKVSVEGNNKTRAAAGRSFHHPKLVGAVRISEQHVTAIRRGHARKKRGIIDVQCACGSERFWR